MADTPETNPDHQIQAAVSGGIDKMSVNILSRIAKYIALPLRIFLMTDKRIIDLTTRSRSLFIGALVTAVLVPLSGCVGVEKIDTKTYTVVVKDDDDQFNKLYGRFPLGRDGERLGLYPYGMDPLTLRPREDYSIKLSELWSPKAVLAAWGPPNSREVKENNTEVWTYLGSSAARDPLGLKIGLLFFFFHAPFPDQHYKTKLYFREQKIEKFEYDTMYKHGPYFEIDEDVGMH